MSVHDPAPLEACIETLDILSVCVTKTVFSSLMAVKENIYLE